MPMDIGSVVVEVLTAQPSPYEPIDATGSALDAVARHLSLLDGIARAERGWPESPTALDLTGGPVATVTFVSEAIDTCPANVVEDTDPLLVRTGFLTITAMIDLWANYQVKLDQAARIVSDGLHNDLPYRAGLHLVSRGYHKRPIVAVADQGRMVDVDRAAVEGEWRRSWMISIRTDLVVVADLPTQDNVILRVGVNDTDEADLTV